MSSVVISGDSSGAITLAAPSVAGTNTATLPAATGTVMVSGNQPTFSAYNTTGQSLTGGVWTKVLFQTKEWDTTSSFSSNTTYTPTVAGYYQVNTQVSFQTTTANFVICAIYKNGSNYKTGGRVQTSGQYTFVNGSTLVYMNGSTDYIEVYAICATNATIDYGPVVETYFNSCLVRSA